jgi:hypothetical protein
VEALDETFFERLVNVQSYSDKELKELAYQLAEQEAELSKRRRLLHGEIDILKAEMVRRLRDKQGAGRSLVNDGDVAALTKILSARPGRDASAEKKVAMADDVKPVIRGIQKRFRDLSVDVREERVVRYIIKQVRLGRHIDEVMADHYLAAHTSDVTRTKLLQHPAVLTAIEQEIRQQFADYRSVTGSGEEDDATH